MELWKKAKRKIFAVAKSENYVPQSESVLPQVKFMSQKHVSKQKGCSCISMEEVLTPMFNSQFNGVIKFASLICHGNYILFIYMDESTKLHKACICSCNNDQHKLLFNVVFEIDVDIKYITHVMLVNQNSVVILGFSNKQKLLLLNYTILLHNLMPTIQYSSCSILPGYRFTPLTTIVTSSGAESCVFAMVLMDNGRHPQPLILYVYELGYVLQLKKFLDLRRFFSNLRGVVSDLCIIANKILLASTCFQLFVLKLSQSDTDPEKEICLREQPVYLEDEEELIYLFKHDYLTEDHCNYIYALTQTCSLYFIKNLPVEDANNSTTEHGLKVGKYLNLNTSFTDIRVSWCTLCKFLESLAILDQGGQLYFYNLRKFQFVLKIDFTITGFRCNLFYDWHMLINWYGDEMFYINQNLICIYNIPNRDLSLKHFCRLKILSCFSEKEIYNAQIPRSLMNYLQLQK